MEPGAVAEGSVGHFRHVPVSDTLGSTRRRSIGSAHLGNTQTRSPARIRDAHSCSRDGLESTRGARVSCDVGSDHHHVAFGYLTTVAGVLRFVRRSGAASTFAAM